MRLVALLVPLSLAWSCGSSPRQRAPGSSPPLQEVEEQLRPPERQQHELTIDGHVFALWEKSAADPKGAVLLVHGRTWSSLPDFDLQVPGEEHSLMDTLTMAGYAVYAIDQRGYGATARDTSGWLSPNRAAADLAEVLRWVKLRSGMRPALLGWSYGSLVAQLCAQQNPKLVSALILYGYPRAIDSNYAAGPDAGVMPARNTTTAEGAAEDFIAEKVSSPAMVKAFVEAALASDPIRVDWRDRDQFNALDPAKIAVPTLLMHGEHDPYAPVAKQAEVFAAIANADKRWVVLPGGDHAAHLESTGPMFVHALITFLSRPSAKP